MSNSNIIITSIVLGVATLAAGGFYLLNRPRNSLKKLPNFGPFEVDSEDEDVKFYSGGKKTKKQCRGHKHTTTKRHK